MLMFYSMAPGCSYFSEVRTLELSVSGRVTGLRDEEEGGPLWPLVAELTS